MITKELIDKFYEDVESLGLKFPVAAIQKETGFGKGTVSQYLNKKLEPSENFLTSFYKAFQKRLQKVSRDTVSDRNITGSKIDSEELMDIMRERIKELKEDKDWLKRNWESNLTGLVIGQKSILAHVATILEKDDERDSAGNKRKEQALKDETGKRIVDKISGVSQMDNSRNG